MHFDERALGDYRIYAGAREATDGYVAAMVVRRIAVPGMPEVYRDESMSGGHRWETADQALRYAIARGTEIVKTELGCVAC
jgi:hypothetical protein